MNKFRKWWQQNHPFKSKYKVVKLSWFIIAVTLGTIIYSFASILSATQHFYNEMKDWFGEIHDVWYKVWK
jgi:hypothetical protein